MHVARPQRHEGRAAHVAPLSAPQRDALPGASLRALLPPPIVCIRERLSEIVSERGMVGGVSGSLEWRSAADSMRMSPPSVFNVGACVGSECESLLNETIFPASRHVHHYNNCLYLIETQGSFLYFFSITRARVCGRQEKRKGNIKRY